MEESDDYKIYIENSIIQLKSNYEKQKENIVFFDNITDINGKVLKDIETTELFNKIKKQTDILLSTPNSFLNKYTEFWIKIFNDEILRRRYEIINNLRKNKTDA